MTVKVSVTDPCLVDALLTGNTRKVMGTAAVHLAAELVRIVVAISGAIAVPTQWYAHRVVQMVDTFKLVVRTGHWRCQSIQYMQTCFVSNNNHTHTHACTHTHTHAHVTHVHAHMRTHTHAHAHTHTHTTV